MSFLWRAKQRSVSNLGTLKFLFKTDQLSKFKFGTQQDKKDFVQSHGGEFLYCEKKIFSQPCISLPNSYYRGAVGALIVYDITRQSSFHNVEKWLNELHEHADENIVVMLVGNKTDMKSSREVSTEDASKFAKAKGLFLLFSAFFFLTFFFFPNTKKACSTLKLLPLKAITLRKHFTKLLMVS